MLSLLFAALLSLPQADDPGKGRLPVQVPEGWTGRRQEAAYVLTPKDLPAGKLYTVISADLLEKVGSIKGLLDAGKASLAESGKFTPLRDPAPGSSVGGWNYEVVMGPLEKDGATLVAQVVAFRKGEDEGLIITVADSIETLTKYSDGFTAIVRNVGAPKPAPTAPAVAGKVDLVYKAPEGWVSKTLDQGVLLADEKSDFYTKYSHRLMILPSEPLTGSLRAKFHEVWAAQIKAGIETAIVPLPLMRRLKSGTVVAFDQDPSAKANGVAHHGGLYLLARGNRCVPILCFFFGEVDAKKLLAAVEPFLESARIPGAGDAAIPLFDAADLVGYWTTTSVSLANYVTASGAYAGDASVATADYLTLNKDGTFKKTFIGVSAKQRFKETLEGTWKLDDASLLLTMKDPAAKAMTYRVFGTGGDAKGGTFLVLSTYSNTDEQADLGMPRRMFSGEWFKRKD